MRNKIIFFSLFLALVVPTYGQRSLVDKLASMKQDEMKHAVEYLASQELGGRYPGTHGDTIASEFIVGQLRDLKLKPVFKGKKNKGFFHDFTYGKGEKRTTHNIIAVLPGKNKKLRNE